MKHQRGYALGVFDLFHVGHLRYLEYASEHCQELWVGVRSDTILTPGKFQKPHFPESQRCELVSGLACVSRAMVFNNSIENAVYWSDWFQRKNITLIVVGGDWEGTQRWEKLTSAFNEKNIEVLFAPRTEGISSSLIRKKIRSLLS